MMMISKLFVVSAVAFTMALYAYAVPARASGADNGSAAAYGQESPWDAPPSEFHEAQRQGFHDGIEGARRDFENHRAPDVNNREEYRHPHVPHNVREEYREGYARGYDRAMSHLMGDRYHSHY